MHHRRILVMMAFGEGMTCPYEGTVVDDGPNSSRGCVEAVVNGSHQLYIAVAAGDG